MKVVVNGCFGGFGLSTQAVVLGRKLSGDDKWGGFVLEGEYYSDGSGPAGRALRDSHSGDYNFPRHDDTLVRVVEELGTEKASGGFAELLIAEVPDGMDYEVGEYDGTEWVEPKGARIYGERINNGPQGGDDHV